MCMNIGWPANYEGGKYISCQSANHVSTPISQRNVLLVIHFIFLFYMPIVIAFPVQTCLL